MPNPMTQRRKMQTADTSKDDDAGNPRTSTPKPYEPACPPLPKHLQYKLEHPPNSRTLHLKKP